MIGGFTKSGYWCDYDKETKTVKRTNKKYSPRGFNSKGMYGNTGRKWNSDLFDDAGYYWEEDPNDSSKRNKTDRKYNEENIDAYGRRRFFLIRDKKEIYLKQNKNSACIGGFDADGNWWNYDEKTNTVSNSYQKYDSKGFEYSGINIGTGKWWNSEGFDRDGYYWKKESKKII